MDVVTTSDPARRGCQLSLRFSCPMEEVHTFLEKRGVAVSLTNIMETAAFDTTPILQYNLVAFYLY